MTTWKTCEGRKLGGYPSGDYPTSFCTICQSSWHKQWLTWGYFYWYMNQYYYRVVDLLVFERRITFCRNIVGTTGWSQTLQQIRCQLSFLANRDIDPESSKLTTFIISLHVWFKFYYFLGSQREMNQILPSMEVVVCPTDNILVYGTT